MTDTTNTSEEYLKKYRLAVVKSQYVWMPDQKAYMIMWRWADQFGIRNFETGEQYAFTYEDAIKHGLVPMMLCPIDINRLTV